MSPQKMTSVDLGLEAEGNRENGEHESLVVEHRSIEHVSWLAELAESQPQVLKSTEVIFCGDISTILYR